MKHIQHTKEFIKELNSINHKVFYTPFRVSDSTWLVGKFAGSRLDELPKNYVIWVINNFKLSDTSRSILQQLIIKNYKKCTIIKKKL